MRMGKNEVNEFLSYLATESYVSASTQNQALGSSFFLNRYVLNIQVELGNNIFISHEVNIFQMFFDRSSQVNHFKFRVSLWPEAPGVLEIKGERYLF